MSEITYEVSNLGDSTWMVKRFKPDGAWDEALIYKNEAVGMNQAEVIQYAIKRGSWA